MYLKHKFLCFLPLRIIPVHFFAHSLTEYLLNIFYIPVTVLGARVDTHVLLLIFDYLERSLSAAPSTKVRGSPCSLSPPTPAPVLMLLSFCAHSTDLSLSFELIFSEKRKASDKCRDIVFPSP